jgi:hypothetical protein
MRFRADPGKIVKPVLYFGMSVFIQKFHISHVLFFYFTNILEI